MPFDLSSLTPEVIGFALLIFFLRVFNYAISTIRTVFIARGMRMGAAVIAFFEALIFAVVIAEVVSDLSDTVVLMAYCLGAAVGSYVGMMIEARFVTSYSDVTIIAPKLGKEIADKLRDARFGVTLTKGEGRDGEVAILHSSLISRQVPHLIEIVQEVNPDAFIDISSVSDVHRGWIPAMPPKRV
jgi:uncharacterized protein YebE (UPF0316 family)